MTLSAIRSAVLDQPGLRHAFFTREGGVSTGIYASLNGGIGSRDSRDAVAENRSRMAAVLDVTPDRLLIPFQVHSALAIAVSSPWSDDDRPLVDGIVTRTPGLAIGVTGADCGVVLFADTSAGVVGACHAGWKGALDGVVAATVSAMQDVGANRSDIVAVLGPTIAQKSYEVGPEFVERFTDTSDSFRRFFTASMNKGNSLFDLPAFIVMRCGEEGLRHVEDLALDTYADEKRFFSYRRTIHRGEPDYGRLVAAIATQAR